MNYSVFKLQNQGGKPSIFWEKETVPKNDRKFGYKNRRQRFPVRRYPGDQNEVETDLVALSPDEQALPPKPAKNFIRRNRDKVTTTKKKEVPSTVTLTQEQLNAILKSVGKVAGGSENAVKISIGGDNSKEITIESPRRRDRYNDDDDDIEDEREKRRSKKRIEPKEEEETSIFSLLDSKKSKPKANSDKDSYISDSTESIEVVKKSRRRRRDRKSRRENDDDEEESKENRNRKGRAKKVYEYNSDDDELKIRKDHSRPRKHEEPDDEYYHERNKNRRNKSRYRDDDDDEDNDYRRDERRRRTRSRKRDDSYDFDDDVDNRDNETRERFRKSERTRVSIERKEKKDQSRERDILNTSENKDQEEIPSPRDKIGLPNDLSWRHMTKAERRRLEMARQRLIDEEERKQDERIHKIEADIGLLDKRRPAPRSDPVTRQDRHYGRDTQTTNHTDGYRRDRKSRSPEDNRGRSPDRSPEILSHHSPEASPKAPVGIPRRHMTLAEKKRLEWEKDRVESKLLGKLDEPWGRPGAGAPLRSRSGHVVADYKGRQDHLHNSVQAIEEESVQEPREHATHVEERTPARDNRYRNEPEPPPTQPAPADGPTVPHAMRTSFVLGQSAPDGERFESSKERERKKWLAELEKQIEEKRLKEMKNTEVKEEDTWANRFGTDHHRIPFPEQPKDTVSATGDILSTLGGVSTSLDTNRASSAPGESDSKSHIRGQNVPIDPLTKKELEDKRQIYLDHQSAIKAQVEEKERLKRQEREKKIKEDLEEERKLQAERDMLQKQFESEQQKVRQKEAQRQAQVNQLKAAMDEAQARALQEKYQRKMERLEAGGHDTSKLREHLEGEITSRIEELHTKRERDIQRAQKVLELQHWGLGPLEEHPSESEPPKSKFTEPSKSEHTAKITPRSEERGYNMHIEPTQVPGLDLNTARTNVYQQPQQVPHPPDADQKPSHQPYTGNRVLTPSRFRHPSKPWSDPTSPRREFGTQTGNRADSASELDGEDINQLLNQSLSRDDSDVHIEYKMERGRRVRVISAPKDALEKRRRQSPASQAPTSHGRSSPHSSRERASPHQHHHEVLQKKENEEVKRKKRLENQRRHGPVKAGSRPMWGYKNPDNKKPKKQSEKDPFYEQKKRISDRRRIERENKLLAMVEKNRDIIPEYYVPAERSARSRDPSPFSDFGAETPRERRVARRSKSHSPNRFNTTAHRDVLNVHSENKRQNQTRDRSQSPVDSRSPARQQDQGHQPRGRSPPIPAIKHRHEAHGGDPNAPGKRGGKYKDPDPLDNPVPNGEFVPFTRTIDVLDPARADEPLPISREATRVANARKTYYESLNPEKFGNKQYVFQDRDRVPKGPEDLKNPIFNPGLVTDHPTTRQDQILMQLSTLKQSLMQRQRELETFSPSDLEKQATNLYIE